MAAESAADRLSMLGEVDFGDVALYYPEQGAAPRSLSGIFDNDYMSAGGEGPQPVAASQPRFVCQSAELVDGGRYDDRLVINGKSYRVREPRPDGTGMTELYLHEAD